MENTKHTQGPWEVLQQGTIPLIKAGQWIVADVCHLADGKNNARLELERTANAKLIAAAPELLEALKDALDMIDTMRFEVSRNMEGVRFTNETVNMTSAALLIGKNAIKKATA